MSFLKIIAQVKKYKVITIKAVNQKINKIKFI